MRIYSKPLRIWRRFSHQQTESPGSVWKKPTGFDTGIVVYNPIIKQKVPLILKNDKIATWYLCGPTVYDSAHIGHACSYVRFDILRRILEKFFNINVVSVMGITDIDDKIIMRSQGSSKFSDWSQLAKFYEQEFYGQMQQLNVLPPYLYGRVSDYIPQMIQFIDKIMSKNFAYIGKDGSVYFDKVNYGKFEKLCKYEIHKDEAHPVKQAICDFALWKAAKPDEPSWESPWGPGRPGWHIECSTIGSFTLGDNIDIHSGGIDLVFPHHENEDAQSCCHHDTDQWVNYWLHSGLLHLRDIKMSKSLQNTISITELLEKYTANQFRMMCLLYNYRTAIEFTHEAMQKAVTILKKFEYFHSDCQNYMAGKLVSKNLDESVIYSKLSEAKKNIHEALANDFSTPVVISELIDLAATVTKMLDSSQKSTIDSGARNIHCISAVSIYISNTLRNLGISHSKEVENKNNKFTEVIDTFVNFRTTVRNKALSGSVKDKETLILCDDVRKKMSVCGVKIKDYKDKSTWTFTEE
ncbi:hypothetical protein PV326_007440 [Microctonus aethiopoides]|uniref:cysteine--tRNA ligase n=1 Tax=Microctonus aethiopoides TaxID=144406 RepID=A0AA39FXP5_9HYME|nr:hypothetical protein PV326_007440 [Microctonus aethiopoides]KAK0177757.1 hypothetical protein PV328_001772 [Microctonus aethiopoides]